MNRAQRRAAAKRAVPAGHMRTGTFPNIVEAANTMLTWSQTARAGGLGLGSLVGLIDNTDQSRVVATFGTRVWLDQARPDLAEKLFATDGELVVIAFDAAHVGASTIGLLVDRVQSLSAMEAISGR